MSENCCANVVVLGRVQGVWFRAFARDVAVELGLKGWVMNKQDGTVRAEVEGERERIEAFLKKVRQGPPLARVDDLKVSWLPFGNRYEEFKIRYW